MNMHNQSNANVADDSYLIQWPTPQTATIDETKLHDFDDEISTDAASGHALADNDRFLPISNIAKIMRRRVQQPNKISQESKEAVQEACTEFIQFIVSEATERCQNEKRKTITGDDIIVAMEQTGLDPYLPSLKLYLEKLRRAMRDVNALAGDISETQNPAMVHGVASSSHADSSASIISESELSAGPSEQTDYNAPHELVPSDTKQRVEIIIQSPDGSTQSKMVPIQTYIDPITNKSYISLENDGIQFTNGQCIRFSDNPENFVKIK